MGRMIQMMDDLTAAVRDIQMQRLGARLYSECIAEAGRTCFPTSAEAHLGEIFIT